MSGETVDQADWKIESLPEVIEQKYLARIPDARILHRRLERLFPRDTVYPSNQIRTLYFDRPIEPTLELREGGFYRRGNLRLRWYPAQQQQPDEMMQCFLEAKCQEGGQRRKFRVPVVLPYSDLSERPLSSPRVRRLAGIRTCLSALTQPAIVPSLVVGYRRERFLHPPTGTRISLDFDIFCPAWKGGAGAGRPFFCRQIVLEVKNTSGELPASLKATGYLFERARFSKYRHFRDSLIRRPEIGGDA